MVGAEGEIDRLYTLPLGEFVAARNELAKALRKAGDRAAAADVKALAKPTVSAWAVNQLARSERQGVRTLLAAGERLRAAQERVLAGGPARELRDAADAERKAVARLVAAARVVLADAGLAATETTLDRVGETLRAAAVDEEARDLLERGRLTRDLDAAGFGPLPASLPASRPPRGAGGRAAEPRVDDRRRERAEATLRERRAEVSELSASLRDAERRADEARRAAEAAAEAAARERGRLEQAQQRLARAERERSLLR